MAGREGRDISTLVTEREALLAREGEAVLAAGQSMQGKQARAGCLVLGLHSPQGSSNKVGICLAGHGCKPSRQHLPHPSTAPLIQARAGSVPYSMPVPSLCSSPSHPEACSVSATTALKDRRAQLRSKEETFGKLLTSAPPGLPLRRRM